MTQEQPAGPTSCVRVCLLGRVDLLGGMIREIVKGRRELKLIANVPGDSLQPALQHHPDVVIWQSSPGTRPGTNPFGGVSPPAVVAVYGDGESGAIWRMQPTVENLGELSPRSLGDAVVLAGREGQEA